MADDNKDPEKLDSEVAQHLQKTLDAIVRRKDNAIHQPRNASSELTPEIAQHLRVNSDATNQRKDGAMMKPRAPSTLSEEDLEKLLSKDRGREL